MAYIPVTFFASDFNGTPLASAKLYLYEAGTTTPQAGYRDATGGTAHANPVVALASGVEVVWLDDSLSYKLVLKSSDGASTVFSQDNIDPANYPAGLIIYPAAQGDQSTRTTDSVQFANGTITTDLTAGQDGSFGRDLDVGRNANVVGDLEVGGDLTLNGASLQDGDLNLTGSFTAAGVSNFTGTIIVPTYDSGDPGQAVNKTYLDTRLSPIELVLPAAEAAVSSAQAAATAAGTAQSLAENYANKAEDSTVEVGPDRYSAFHWSKKAEAFASTAETTVALAQGVIDDIALGASSAILNAEGFASSAITAASAAATSASAASTSASSSATSATAAATSASEAAADALQTDSDAALTFALASSFTKYFAPGEYATPAAAVAANPYAEAYSTRTIRSTDGLVMLLTNVTSGQEAWRVTDYEFEVASNTEMLARYAGAEVGDLFLVRATGKTWMKTDQDIKSVCDVDTYGMIARAPTGEDGTTGGFVTPSTTFDIADADFGLVFETASAGQRTENVTRLNALSAIIEAAVASSAFNYTSIVRPLVTSSRAGQLYLDGEIKFTPARIEYRWPATLFFMFTQASGNGIVYGKDSVDFSTSNDVTVWFTNARFTKTKHKDGFGVLFQNISKGSAWKTVTVGSESGIGEKNCDHFHHYHQRPEFGNRERCMKYFFAVLGPDSALAESPGFNTSNYRYGANLSSSSDWPGVCALAGEYYERYDGRWDTNCHTIDCAIGVWVNGVEDAGGYGHCVSLFKTADYSDQNLVANYLFTGRNLKKIQISASEARAVGYGGTKNYVVDDTLTAPPVSPTTGDYYIVAGTATGDWAGHEGDFAQWDGSEWIFLEPCDGMITWVLDSGNGTVKQYTESTNTWAAASIDGRSLVGGCAIQAYPASGETFDDIILSKVLVEGASREAVRVAESAGTITGFVCDLTVDDVNKRDVALVSEAYIEVTSGRYSAVHKGGVAGGKAVTLSANCGAGFTLGPLNLNASITGDGTTYASKVADLRASGQAEYIHILESGEFAVADMTAANITATDITATGTVETNDLTVTGTADLATLDVTGLATVGGLLADYLDAQEISIATDSVGEIVIPAGAIDPPSTGLIFVMTNVTGHWILAHYISGSGLEVIANGTNFEAVTSPTDLTGTTETDLKSTLSLNTSNNIDIANRRNSTTVYKYLLIG